MSLLTRIEPALKGALLAQNPQRKLLVRKQGTLLGGGYTRKPTLSYFFANVIATPFIQ